MELETREISGAVVIEISGEINVGNAPRIREEVTRLIGSGKHVLLINMGGVEAIDSSGIGALVHTLTNIKKVKGTLKICAISPPVRRILELMKLPAIFDIYESEDEAVASLNS